MTKEQLENQNKALRAEAKELKMHLDSACRELESTKKEVAKLTTQSNDDIYSRAVNTFGETSRLILSIE